MPWERMLSVCEWAWKKVPERGGPKKKMRLACGEPEDSNRRGVALHTHVHTSCPDTPPRQT